MKVIKFRNNIPRKEVFRIKLYYFTFEKIICGKILLGRKPDCLVFMFRKFDIAIYFGKSTFIKIGGENGRR